MLYDYSGEPLWQIFCDQDPELGCLKRNQITTALIAAGINAVDVVKTFDEIDRNRDNLVTYEEFRYYVGVIQGQTQMLNVNNLSHMMTASDAQQLEVFREQWNIVAEDGVEKI